MSDNAQSLIEQARERFNQAENAWKEIREAAREDIRMVNGDQWDPAVKAARDEAKRPALTFNREHTLVQQVTNRARQERPQPNIKPADDTATPETAEVFEGHLRHIQNASQADVAYDNAVECSASGGFGYYRITTEYIDETSFNQEPRIRRILDPMTVYFDPNAEEPDFSDAEYCFVRKRMTKEAFRREFNTEPLDFDADGAKGWIDGEDVWIAEYYYVTKTKKRLVVLTDGTIGLEDDLKKQLGVEALKDEWIQQERDVEQRAVSYCLMDGEKELSKTPWIGQWIPIIPVLAREVVVDGKRRLNSLVRFTHGGQKLLNAYKSGIAESLGGASRAQFLGYTGQFKKQAWRDGSRPLYLEAEMLSADGKPAPLPQIIDHEPPIQALSQAALQEADDIKASVGYIDSVLQPSRADLSGVAVQRRSQQADLTNFHLIDNLKRSQWHCARVLIDLIQKLYDVPREIRTMKEDGTVGRALIAAGGIRVQGREAEPHHDLGAGRYDVVIENGPGYQTRLDEQGDFLDAMFAKNPQLVTMYGDIYFKIRGYRELEERAKLTLAPPVQQALAAQQQGIPPAAQAQIGALSAQLQALKQALQKLLMERQAKVVESDSREKIAVINARKDIEVESMRQGHEERLALFEAELQSIQQKLDMFHESELAPDPNAAPEGQPNQ